MLRRIESIANVAVWSGYEGRTSPAPDFRRYNLIYGWNASGKTTLSRAIGLFMGSNPARLPADARIRATVGQEILDSAKEVDRSRVTIRIFNRDFIEDNLQRDGYEQAPALLIVGRENIRLTNRIASLDRRRERLASMYRSVRKAQTEASGLREKAATDLARECGTLLGIRDFRAPNLKGLSQRIANKADHLLDEPTLHSVVAQARDQSEFAPFRNWPILTQPELPRVDDISRLLRETPQQNAVKRLTDDPALSDWVRSGLRFHEHTTACAFCGGDAEHALAAYGKHFSDEYQRQRAAIEAAIGRLEQSRKLPDFPHDKDWVPSLRVEAQDALGRLSEWYVQEREVRSAWIRLLREKLTSMDAVLSVVQTGDQAASLVAILSDLQRAKEAHDRACDELAAVRRGAAEKVKEHFAVRHLLDPGAAEAEETIVQANAVLDRVQKVGQKIGRQAEAAHAELQRSSVAASQINDLLKRLLGPRISVEQALDKRIRFVREGQPATNMSDGERTAISLAYFLVSLEQAGRRLDDQIVFIDDPICSLDANHIYDVAYLLIKSLKTCRQLFISTHNSEFFNTIKQDWADRGEFKKEHAAFLINRESDGSSQLSQLPTHLAKFRSDYHHIFHCLRKFQVSVSSDIDAYLGCPNLLRRFLEMYLGFRRPTAKSYVTKLDVLFGDEAERGAVARYVDEGSHSTSTLRLLEHSDFPAVSRVMVERVMRALERVDPEHFSMLVAETS